MSVAAEAECWSQESHITSFKVLKDCLRWLGDIRRGTSWHEELEALFFEVDDETYGAAEVDGAEGTAD